MDSVLISLAPLSRQVKAATDCVVILFIISPFSRQVKADTLHGAAKLGDAEAAEALIAEGAQVNTKDSRGITALGVAVGFNKLAVIQVLLRAGADVTLTDAKGNTPLHYAAGAPAYAPKRGEREA